MKLFLNDPDCSQQGCPKLGRSIKAELEYILFPPQNQKERKAIRDELDIRLSRTLDALIRESERRDIEEIVVLESRVNRLLSDYGMNLYDETKFDKHLEDGKLIYLAKDQSSPIQRVAIRNKGLIRWINKAFKTVGYDNKHEDDLSGITIVVYDEIHMNVDLCELSKNIEPDHLKQVLKDFLKEINAFHGKKGKFDKWFKRKYGRLSAEETLNSIKDLYAKKYDPPVSVLGSGGKPKPDCPTTINGISEDMLVGDGIIASWVRSLYAEYFIEDLVKVGSYIIDYRHIPVSTKSQEAIDLDNSRNHLAYDIMLFGYNGREIDQDLRAVQNNPEHMLVRTALEYFNEKFSKRGSYLKIPLRGYAKKKSYSDELGVDKTFCFIDKETGKKNLAVLKGNTIIRYEELGNMTQTAFIDNCSNFLKLSLDTKKFTSKDKEEDGLTVSNMLPSQTAILAHNMIVYPNEEPVGWLFRYPVDQIGRVKKLSASSKCHVLPDQALTSNFLGYFKDYRLNPKRSGYRAYQAKEFGEREIKIMTPLDYYEAEFGGCSHDGYSLKTDEKVLEEKIMRYCKKIVNDQGGKFTANKMNAVKGFVEKVFSLASEKYQRLLLTKLNETERKMATGSDYYDAISHREEFTMLYQRFCREMPGVNISEDYQKRIDDVLLK